MKALFKSGLCLALGWLASGAGAQEAPIKWQAVPAKNSSPSEVISFVGNTTVRSDTGPRPVGLRQPIPLDDTGIPAFRPVSVPFVPTVRGQVADDKSVQPVPTLEVGPTEQKPPKKMPTDGFTPPAPQRAPSPVFGNLGITPEDGCFGPCGPSACGPCRLDCDGCCPQRRCFWASAEYLMWWQRSQSVPPLVTSASPGNAPVLGPATTNILFDSVPNQTRSGARFALGMWMPHFENKLGVEVDYFFLGRQSNTAVYSSNGNPVLGRPFFDVTPPALGGIPGPNAEVFATNDRAGTATIHSFSQLWGIEGNLRYKACCGCNYWIDIVGGYRHLNLSEGIDITERLQFNAAPNFSVVEHESFRTRNQFDGAQLGLDGEWRPWNRLFIGSTAKLAMGNVYQIVNIDGSTTFAANGITPVTRQGALLASPTNIGRFTSNRFGVVPEVGFKVGIDVTEHLRLFVGYDFLDLTSVVRPGDQIDLNVNQAYRPSLLGPGAGVAAGSVPRQPAVLFRTTDYWAQGLNFGLLYRY